MKKISLGLISSLLVLSVLGQTIAGDWHGSLKTNGSSIPLIFHIERNGDRYITTMDSPDQGAKGIVCDSTAVNGQQLLIVAKQYNLKYAGTYKTDSNKISGTFIQGGVSLPLELTKTEALPSPIIPQKRPQDPSDFPYKQENVSFPSPKSGNILAGTLSIPSDGKVSKIVILVTGSGPQNRNEEIKAFNHRPFLVWSDWLTRKGIAVLRYDDRGIGQSSGNYSSATTKDFSDDAEAAVNFVLSRRDLHKLSIGIMGHSEGGMIAPMVACRNNHVKFVVMLAGPGVPISELMLKQSDDQLRLAGAPESARKLSGNTNKKLYQLVIDNPDLSTEQLKSKVDTLLYRQLSAMPKEDLGETNIDQTIKANDVQVTSAWYRYFIAFQPADYLTRVKCPLLAINGSLDMQVNAEMNLKGVKSSLEKGGNKNFEVIELEGLNHLFQKAETGSVAEYGQIAETINTIALQKVSNWINKL